MIDGIYRFINREIMLDCRKPHFENNINNEYWHTIEYESVHSVFYTIIGESVHRSKIISV